MDVELRLSIPETAPKALLFSPWRPNVAIQPSTAQLKLSHLDLPQLPASFLQWPSAEQRRPLGLDW
jgi:hypothetical protein